MYEDNDKKKEEKTNILKLVMIGKYYSDKKEGEREREYTSIKRKEAFIVVSLER